MKQKHHYVRGTIRERFAAKVDVNGPTPEHRPEIGPCHVWIAGLGSHGYGEITDTRGEVGPVNKKYRVHRAALMLAGTDVPADAVVMHECDRPACVNIAHLTIGTQTDNMADRHAKGRTFRRTLTDEQRVRLRECRAAGWPYKRIAAEFGMAVNTLTRILTDERRDRAA